MGSDGGPGPARRGRRGDSAGDRYREGPPVLGVSPAATARAAPGAGHGLALLGHRPLPFGWAGGPRLAAGRGCGSTHTAPPRLLRSDRLASDSGRGRSLRRRLLAAGVRGTRGPAAGLPAVRRALGPALARRGPLRRDERPAGQLQLSPRL